MNYKTMIILTALMMSIVPAFADDSSNVADTVASLQRQLDLQQDQVSNVTAVIEQYDQQFQTLQKSVDDGSMNPSAIQTQRQGIEEAETQALSQYLKPYQLSEWRSLQASTEPSGGNNADEYSNLPNNPSSSQ